jgi:hypothetical protein
MRPEPPARGTFVFTCIGFRKPGIDRYIDLPVIVVTALIVVVITSE